MNVKIRYDWLVLLLAIVLTALFARDVIHIPPSHYEPLGEAAIPIATLWLLGLLCVLKIIKLIQKSTEKISEPVNDTIKPLTLLFLVILFVTALAILQLPFWLAVFGFLITSIICLKRPQTLMEAGIQIAISLAFSLVTDYLFTQVFRFGF